MDKKVIKNVGENDFYYLSQVLNANIWDLVNKKKEFFPYDYWDSFEKFKEGLPSKNIFYNLLTNHTNFD